MGCRCCTAAPPTKEAEGDGKPPQMEGDPNAVEVKAKEGPNVKVHFGPLEVSSGGVVLKPKFSVGFQSGHIYAVGGMRDVRDGLAVEALAMGQKTYCTSGSSLVEFLQKIKATDPIPVLDDVITAVPQIVAAVLEITGIDIQAPGKEVEGLLYLYSGIGVTAGAYLGWTDTSGYRMVGAEGKIAAAVGLGMTIRVGMHEDEKSVRIVFFLSNVGGDVKVFV
uniref:Uncharacterized protein n=1 Tax=Chromera velia CCMP2878 TaxID=1169474 RepID=A0A0G4GQS5_9ALVE|eukprot:Cvel_22966.t1-p1 / transcript=Cvel_22966.t1 / gene=Cvel_22966 / organism=Chromera_velia_CCMP2878 / gene_product=hypothetical protein / transcript_product=hypothetical protein / location=Cvel_scaffold2314:16465-17124(+) / protein_length=220 / sequence_SO=supercontig / SO=protein_coding / is_pseudo=false